MKKENVYINLQGKSKEELTELWEFLDSIGEKQFRDSLNDFLNNYYGWTAYEFSCNSWLFSSSKVLIEKTEVTIEQLKEILQPMENTLFDLKGFSVKVDNEEQAKQLQEMAFKQGFEWYDGKTLQFLNEKFFAFNAFNENKIHWGCKHLKDEYVTKQISFNDIFKDSLEQRLEKAEAEVKRLQSLIEEENKPKVGDWVRRKDNCIWKIRDEYDINTYLLKDCKKITNPELIKLIEDETNENNLFR